jgi:hypothetical protein
MLPRQPLQERRVQRANLLEALQRLPLLQRAQEGLRSRLRSCRVSIKLLGLYCFGPVICDVLGCGNFVIKPT